MMSVCLAPVGAIADIHLERYLQLCSLRHLLLNQKFHPYQLLFRYLKDQFVMDLHDQAAPALLPPYSCIHPDHGALDDIGSRRPKMVVTNPCASAWLMQSSRKAMAPLWRSL